MLRGVPHAEIAHRVVLSTATDCGRCRIFITDVSAPVSSNVLMFLFSIVQFIKKEFERSFFPVCCRQRE